MRRLFNIAAAVSLLLCGTIGIAWIATWQVPIGFCLSRPGGNLYVIGGSRGAISFGALGPYPDREFRIVSTKSVGFTASMQTPHRMGRVLQTISLSGTLPLDPDGHVRWTDWNSKPPTAATRVPVTVWLGVTPAWAPLILALLLPLAWVVMRARQMLRNRRPKPGECLNCRYDLTANTSGICPECGTMVPIPEP